MVRPLGRILECQIGHLRPQMGLGEMAAGKMETTTMYDAGGYDGLWTVAMRLCDDDVGIGRRPEGKSGGVSMRRHDDDNRAHECEDGGGNDRWTKAMHVMTMAVKMET